MSLLTQLPENHYAANAFADFEAVAAFNVGTARALAWLSQLVYESDPRKLARVSRRLDIAPIGEQIVKGVATPLPMAATRAMVVMAKGAAVVAFAGTDPLELANWVTDFDIRNTDDGTAEGLLVAMKAVKDDIIARLPPTGPVLVTGHSLGGALGILLADRLSAGGREVTAIYTFGNPRPGRADFAAAYNTGPLAHRTYRQVHGNDLVPTVAPSGLGFRHAGLYVPLRGEKFAGPAGLSDDPSFREGIAQELSGFLHQPLAALPAFADQFIGVADRLLGRAGPGMRDDPVGIAIELLPPRIRSHMLDRYIGACVA